jgi:hypothetical protein
MSEFCLFTTQKLAPGGQIVKKIAGLNQGAASHSNFFSLSNLAPLDNDLLAKAIVRRTAAKFETRNRSNRSQGFSSETKRRQRKKIFSLTNLAGGMTFKRQKSVLTIHTTAIVSDPDQLTSTSFKFNQDFVSASINRIFNQFLDHGSRTFHNFARSNLITKTFVQKYYSGMVSQEILYFIGSKQL